MSKKLLFFGAVVRYGLKSKFTYRMSSLLAIAGHAIGFLGEVMIWVSLLKNGVRFDTSLKQMITFMVLTAIVSRLLASSAGNEISNRIHDGSFAMDLIRPMSIKWYLFFSDIGKNTFNVIVVFVPLCVVLALGFGFVLPGTITQFAAFLAVLVLGAALRFYYGYILGMFSFWLIRNPFTTWHFRNVESIFAGIFMPLWMYPAWLEAITRYLPFRYFSYEAIAIYLGKSPVEGIWLVMVIQLFWLLILYSIERLLWNRALNKLVIHGG